MTLRILIAVAMLAAGCAGRTAKVAVPPSHRIFATAPDGALTTMVLLTCGNRMRGWGTPISPTSLVTAHHVIENCPSIEWRDRFERSGHLIVIGFKACEETPDQGPSGGDCDWAHLVTAEGVVFDRYATVSKELPQNGETLWWYLFLEGWVFHPVSGPFVGLDKYNRFHVNGTSYAGSSGSGLFNGDGELVAVLAGHGGPPASNYLVYGTRMAAILR